MKPCEEFISAKAANNIDKLKRKLVDIISKSKVPEDPVHAQDTLNWLLILKPDADEVLQIAALGHDIERAIEERKIKRDLFSNYDKFKSTHAKNSAVILKEIMKTYYFDTKFIEEVYDLICRHEFGGDLRADLIKDADSLSFFSSNLPFYYKREGWKMTLKRCLWGYKRLTPRGRKIFYQKFIFKKLTSANGR